ncbi:unnamed protein product [Cylicocyclus nassatus]|uniref:H15 domain-containing protein n=1 Tax=Cylicocyclus nassatus TaxID=53992 RepID=A0AA36MA53_CYLNA|nr:unnamed protein product [Cylicocyclus nassatus]
MSDAVAANPTADPAQAPPAKKSKGTKPKGEKKAKVASHPAYGAMIKAAVKELKDRKGSSKQAILKYIIQKYKVGDNEKQINARLRLALKKGVKDGLLRQASGTGASGRFRLAEKTETPMKPKVAKKPKSASEAKPKAAAAAKPKTPKAKKEKSAKSPKKAAAKPKAKSAKSPKKSATPKKAPSKAKTAKKPAAKKTAAAKA